MKKAALLILLVVVFFGVFAQKRDTSGVIRCLANLPQKNAKLIIDNEIMDQSSANLKLQKIDPTEILELSVLNDSVSLTSSASGTSQQTVIVVTKNYAHTQVELFLLARASGYRNYRKDHPDDKDIFYVVDGNLVAGKPDDVLQTLYDTLMNKRIAFAGILDKYNSGIAGQAHTGIIIKTEKQ